MKRNFRNSFSHVEILCFTFGILCRADSDFRQNRSEGHQLGSGDGYPHVSHLVYHLGNRSCRKPHGRGERHQRTYMDIPHSVRCRHRPLVAVLLQGIAGRGCIACGTDRQIERGDYHLPLLSVSERAGQPAGDHRGIAHYGRQYRNVNKVEEYENIDYRR